MKMPPTSPSSVLITTAPTWRAAITSTASATEADAGTEMSSSLALSCRTCSTVTVCIAVSSPGHPKSSSRMFSRSTPRSISIEMTAFVIGPGPHM